MSKSFFNLALCAALLVGGGSLMCPISVEAEEVTKAADAADTDGDGLTDVKELTVYHTDPLKKDTDGDGFEDGWELKNGFSPLHGKKARLLGVDSDRDGMNDGWELSYGTDLLEPDTDGDGFKDGQEVMAGFNPLDASNTARLPKIIRVSLAKQRLTYYLGDRQLETLAVSTGVRGMETPLGEFSVMKKVPVARYKGETYDFPNTKWNLLFTRRQAGFYIHGAYWHSNWGHPMSHGCVNVSYERMGRLYGWADVGTKVVIN